MKNKKQSQDWKIALVHFLMSYVVSVILAFLIMFLASFVLVELGQSAINLTSVVLYIVSILSIWLAVRTSGSYITRNYVINNVDKILKFATIYYVIIVFGWSLLNLKNTLASTSYSLVIAQWVVLIIGVFVFYIAGKKYIKNS